MGIEGFSEGRCLLTDSCGSTVVFLLGDGVKILLYFVGSLLMTHPQISYYLIFPLYCRIIITITHPIHPIPHPKLQSSPCIPIKATICFLIIVFDHLRSLSSFSAFSITFLSYVRDTKLSPSFSMSSLMFLRVSSQGFCMPRLLQMSLSWVTTSSLLNCSYYEDILIIMKAIQTLN
jgi:hypothetical protein